MVDGTFHVCEVCGGDVTVAHITDAHLAEPGTAGEIHLVWTHAKCMVQAETPISMQDYKSILSHARQAQGAHGVIVPSEGDELMAEFRDSMERVQTVADLEAAWA